MSFFVLRLQEKADCESIDREQKSQALFANGIGGDITLGSSARGVIVRLATLLVRMRERGKNLAI